MKADTPKSNDKNRPGPLAEKWTLQWTLVFLSMTAVALGIISLLGGIYSDDILRSRFYQSWWFRAIVSGVCVLTVYCLTRWRRVRSGFIPVHLAFVLLCTGALMASFTETRNYMMVGRGQVTRVLTDGQGKAQGELPFQIRLNQFSIEHYPQEPRLLLVQDNHILASVTAKEGNVLKHEGIQLEVLGVKKPEVKPPDVSKPVSLILQHPADGSARLAVVRGEGTEPLETFEAKPDTVFKVPALTSEVKVLRYFHDFIISANEPTNRSDQPNNPAVKLLYTALDSGETREAWMFAKFPDFGSGKGSAHGAGHEINKEPKLQVRVLGTKPVEVELNREQAILLPGGDEHAGHAGHNHQPLLFWDHSEGAVKDFLSDLSVLINDQEVQRQTIEVNLPLKYQGYIFYQMSYDKDNLSYTTLEVVRDPWLPLFYIGALLLVLGTIRMCWFPSRGKDGAK